MPVLRIVLDPDRRGLGEEFARARLEGTLIHLANDAEIVVSGLPDGMRSGEASMAIGLVLPDGRCVIAQTSWRLFAAAFWAFADKFGTAKPDATGMALEYDATGAGQRVHLDLVADEAPKFFECELCGERFDPQSDDPEEASIEVLQFVHRHFREKHPGRHTP